MNSSYKNSIKKGDLVSFLLIAILGTYLTAPNQFRGDSGPTISETWRINETRLDITLVKISEYPKSATFTDGFNEYSLGENEWITISGKTFKIRIYPEKGYVWVIFKEGDWATHIKKSIVFWMVIGVVLFYLHRKGIEIP